MLKKKLQFRLYVQNRNILNILKVAGDFLADHYEILIFTSKF